MATFSPRRGEYEAGPSSSRHRAAKRPRTSAVVSRVNRSRLIFSPSPSPSDSSAANSGDSRRGAYNSPIRPPTYRSPVYAHRSFPASPSNNTYDDDYDDDDYSPSNTHYDDDNYEDQEEEERNNRRSVDEVRSSQRGENSSRSGDGENVVGPVSVTLMDPDLLDCPICLEPLNWPVYQCGNGHIACESCCRNMSEKCASCCLPIGSNRCRALEKVLESLRISCKYARYGCTDLINYSLKHTHEKSCNYAPCHCPHLGCTYLDSPQSVYSHFASRHWNTTKRFSFGFQFSVSVGEGQDHVFLQEDDTEKIFVLNRRIENAGNYVGVTFIAPVSSEKEYLYKLTAKDGVRSIMVTTVAECTARWSAEDAIKRFVVIPNEFVSSTGQLELELTIWRNSTFEF